MTVLRTLLYVKMRMVKKTIQQLFLARMHENLIGAGLTAYFSPLKEVVNALVLQRKA